MANEIKVRAQVREAMGRHARQLRAQGLTPGNISGGGQPSIAIQMDQHALHDIIKATGAPILRITIEPGGATDTALLARVERDPVSTAILHVDLRRIVLTQVIKARVPLRTEGDAPAVKVYNGILLHLMENVEVEALPRNLPDALTIDISGLTELNSTLTAKDIKTPANVHVLVSPDEPVITVKAPRVETAGEVATEAGEQAPLTATEATTRAAETTDAE
ncbi:MAG TPA: 50S ribosomal protein L25 [Ktedonobacterales bacterium]